jgi:putative transposase
LVKLSPKDDEYWQEGRDGKGRPLPDDDDQLPSSFSLINFHFIFVPKRREDVLTEEVALQVQEEIFAIALQNQWRVLVVGIHPDHIHLLVNVTVNDSARRVAHQFQGRMPSTWSPSYFVCSVGNVSTEVVAQIIESQYTHTTRGINN